MLEKHAIIVQKYQYELEVCIRVIQRREDAASPRLALS